MKFEKTILHKVDFRSSSLLETNFTGCVFKEVNLSYTSLIETIFTDATLADCKVFGVSAWKVECTNTKQKNLYINDINEPQISVDDLEIAQFIYLLLNNNKIRNVISAVAQKGVLILGRFTPERKKVLDAIRKRLQEENFIPIMFDFEKVESRDFTETIKILAGISKFVIADITNPRSTPLELQATVPDYMIPFVPIIQEGENAFEMFEGLKTKYNWVLKPLSYESESELMEVFQEGIINRALEVEERLLRQKTKKQMETLKAKDILSKKAKQEG